MGIRTQRLLTAVAVVIAAPTALSPRPAAAAMVYQADFEPPAFTPGRLIPPGSVSGQGGFRAGTGGISTAAPSITTEFPSTGGHSVRIDGGLLETNPGGSWTGFYIPFAVGMLYDPLASGTPLVTIRADFALLGPATTEDLVSVNLAAYGPSGGPNRFNEMWLSSDGTAWILGAEGLSRTAPFRLNEYNTVAMTLDFTRNTTEFFLNGDSLGIRGFQYFTGSGFFGGFRMVGIPQPTAYRAYVDNLEITATAVPEPAGFKLLGAGILALLGSGWRRRCARA